MVGLSAVYPYGVRILDLELSNGEVGCVIGNRNTEITVRGYCPSTRRIRTHNPESKPPSRGVHGESSEDWVTVWFFCLNVKTTRSPGSAF